MGIRAAFSCTLLAVLAAFGLGMGGLLVHTARARSTDALRARLLAIAVTAAARLDGDQHERIRGPTDPEFERLRRQLRRVQAENQLETAIYTLAPSGPHTTRFVVMTNSTPFVGETYRYRAEMRATFERGEATATQVYEDEHGTWISAYAPVRAADGRVVGLLEVDETAATLGRLHREEAATLLALLGSCLLGGTVIAVAVGTPFARRFERSREELRASMSALETSNAALERERRAQALFGRVLAAVLTDPDEEGICRGALEALLQETGALVGAGYLRDDQVWRVVASIGLGEEEAPGPSDGRDPGIVGRAGAERKPVVAPRAVAVDAGVGRVEVTSVALPAVHGSAALAVLVLGFRDPPGEEAVEALRPALAHVGAALANAIAARRTRELAALLRRSEVDLWANARALEAANVELSDANRYKSEFIANMSHEFRTPLNSVLGYADLASLSMPEGAGREHLGRLREAAERLLDLIEDLLTYARVEAGRDVLRPERVLLADELERQRSVLLGLVAAGVEVSVELPDPTLEVTTDRGKLGQILTNLIGNAAKFTEQGAVTLSAQRQGDDVLVSVRDTGPGIPAEHRSAVFEAFRQVDGSATRRHGGTGLGLTIAGRLAAMLGGRIELDSTPGRGSTFTLVLPDEPVVAPTPAASDGGIAEAEQPLHEEVRVLLVSEDEEERRRLVALLATEGATVSTCTPAGLGSLVPDELDAVILDLEGDGLDGLRSLRAIRQHPSLSASPVVVVGREGDRPRALAVPAVDYLAKPVDGQALWGALERCVGRLPAFVLVVDDDDGSRELTAALLARRGCEVARARDGIEALTRMQERRPDAVVLDLMMPGLSGFDVLTTMAADAELREVPVVVLTAKDLDPREREQLRQGVAAVVGKASTDVWSRVLRSLRQVAIGQAPE